jgi:diacylglycerol kinase family enzyme
LASLGLSVPVAERVPAGLKRVLGRGAYPLTALALLPGHRPFTVRVWAHGRWHQLRTHQFNIANGSHQAGRAIAADAALDDGQLVAYGLGDSTRRRLVAATVRQALAGPYRPVARASFLAAPELWLDTDPPARLDIDGEIHGGTPLHITVEPKALRVMVPAPTPRGSAGR